VGGLRDLHRHFLRGELMGFFYKTEDPDPEDWTPTHSGRRAYTCRDASCRKILSSREVRFFAGWSWCAEHYREVVDLSMTPDQRELAGQERASRADIERDDTYNRVRR
jgi:hypothetical protein